jgi:hypothetical protein
MKKLTRHQGQQKWNGVYKRRHAANNPEKHVNSQLARKLELHFLQSIVKGQ